MYNPPLKQYVDILLVTALEEEQFILNKKIFDNSLTEHFEGKKVSYSKIGKLNIALADLGGMGNVWAMDSTIQLIDSLSPRFVILFGLAGGNQKNTKLGDVVFSKEIFYSSFSKIKAKSSQSFLLEMVDKCSNQKKSIKRIVEKLIRANDNLLKNTLTITEIEPRKAESISIEQIFINACLRNSNNNNDDAEWSLFAKKQFYLYKKKFEKWANNYPVQEPFENGLPIAFGAAIASGEAIIADNKYRDEIEQMYNSVNLRNKQETKVLLFEMEAFGFAKACQLRNIPFGVIKGVSDYAGADKQSDQADKYRFAAITSASAFVLTLLEEDIFVNEVVTKFHRLWDRTACIWTDGKIQKCGLLTSNNHTEKTFFNPKRECTEPQYAPQKIIKKQVLGSNLFEDIDTQDYSTWIANAMDDTNANILLMYPYTTRELLAFLASSQNIDWQNEIKNIEKMSHETLTDSNNLELINAVKKLGGKGKSAYTHLSISDNLCAKMIESNNNFAEIAKRICRIVFYRNDHDKNTPLKLLHPAICGITVPTILASPKVAQDFFADEVTFIRISGKNGTITRCLKYSEKSKLLILLGRCDNLPNQDTNCGKIHDLSNDVFEYLIDFNQNDGHRYKVFPTIKLLKEFDCTWKDFFPIKNLTKEKEQIVDNYFKKLEKFENGELNN